MVSYSNLSIIFLDSTQNIEQIGNINLFLRLDFAPRFASDWPTRALWRVYFIHFYQPYSVRLGHPKCGAAGPLGKGILMTFDLERYRAHVAPLKLIPEQEDELLRDLWAIMETLVDQSLAASPTYPQQLDIACNAFDAFEQAVAVQSEDQHQEGQKEEEEAL